MLNYPGCHYLYSSLHVFPNTIALFQLGRLKIGIVGLGSIGSRVAKRLAAFNYSISYTSRKQKPSVPYSFYPDVYELAENSNVLVLCCPLTDETRHMISKEVLLALGKQGI
ncbi:Glyoxylate/hydroxypyruvate reductase HPR3 [Bienertia sinuspersici]